MRTRYNCRPEWAGRVISLKSKSKRIPQLCRSTDLTNWCTLITLCMKKCWTANQQRMHGCRNQESGALISNTINSPRKRSFWSSISSRYGSTRLATMRPQIQQSQSIDINPLTSIHHQSVAHTCEATSSAFVLAYHRCRHLLAQLLCVRRPV